MFNYDRVAHLKVPRVSISLIIVKRSCMQKAVYIKTLSLAWPQTPGTQE